MKTFLKGINILFLAVVIIIACQFYFVTTAFWVGIGSQYRQVSKYVEPLKKGKYLLAARRLDEYSDVGALKFDRKLKTAQIYLIGGFPRRARTKFREALEFDRGQTEAYLGLARSQRKSNESAGYEYYREAFQEAARSGVCWPAYEWAIALAADGKIERAHQVLDQAGDRRRVADPGLEATRAAIYLNQNKIDRAAEAIEKAEPIAVSLTRGSGEYHWISGILALLAGENEKAKTHFEKAKEDENFPGEMAFRAQVMGKAEFKIWAGLNERTKSLLSENSDQPVTVPGENFSAWRQKQRRKLEEWM